MVSWIHVASHISSSMEVNAIKWITMNLAELNTTFACSTPIEQHKPSGETLMRHGIISLSSWITSPCRVAGAPGAPSTMPCGQAGPGRRPPSQT